MRRARACQSWSRRDWDTVKMFETWDTAETQVSRHETSQNNLTLLWHAFTKHTLQSYTCRLRNDLYCVEWDVKLYYTIPIPYSHTQIVWEVHAPPIRPWLMALYKCAFDWLIDWLTSTYYCRAVIECHIKCWLHWLQTPQNCNAQTVCVMSEVRIKLRHSKTVVRQNQDETWSYETRAETRHECVETEPRNYVSRVLVLSPFTSPLARSIEVD